MPIKNAQGNVTGVAQLTNKLDKTPFNKNDENLFEVLKRNYYAIIFLVFIFKTMWIRWVEILY